MDEKLVVTLNRSLQVRNGLLMRLCNLCNAEAAIRMGETGRHVAHYVLEASRSLAEVRHCQFKFVLDYFFNLGVRPRGRVFESSVASLDCLSGLAASKISGAESDASRNHTDHHPVRMGFDSPRFRR
jgi:hypothetical protein